MFLENLEQLQKCDEKHFARVPPRGPVLFLENLEQLQKCAEKNSREFPLGGPSPCGKTGLAPCRQSTCFSCFVCSPFFLFYLFFIFGPNLTKTDLQNHLPKRVCPTASSPQAQKFEPLLPILPEKKCFKKNGSCKVRLINVLFLENLEQLQKCDEKNFARVPPRGPSPCGKTGLAPCRQSTFSSCFVCSPFFRIYLFLLLDQTLQKQTSKITSQSVSAQQLLPHRLKNLKPSYQSYQKKMFKKKWELQSSAHKRFVS